MKSSQTGGNLEARWDLISTDVDQCAGSVARKLIVRFFCDDALDTLGTGHL